MLLLMSRPPIVARTRKRYTHLVIPALILAAAVAVGLGAFDGVALGVPIPVLGAP